ncbi:hypothetical protein Barb4_02208 [Bacteroidales bacterium Barb4]|nr:hypothetical protein Barb4_02208 [Bacteroidales bacterium Barb4]
MTVVQITIIVNRLGIYATASLAISFTGFHTYENILYAKSSVCGKIENRIGMIISSCAIISTYRPKLAPKFSKATCRCVSSSS